MNEAVRTFAKRIVDDDFGGSVNAAVSKSAKKYIDVSQPHLRDTLRGQRIGLKIILALAEYDDAPLDDVVGRKLRVKHSRYPNLESLVAKDGGFLSKGAIALVRGVRWPADKTEDEWREILLAVMVFEKQLLRLHGREMPRETATTEGTMVQFRAGQRGAEAQEPAPSTIGPATATPPGRTGEEESEPNTPDPRLLGDPEGALRANAGRKGR